jgi:hypothetical protein
VLEVLVLNPVDNGLHITPQEKKIQWVKSGDLGGQAVVPPLSIHLPAICLSRWFLTWWQKCGGAPSCWRIVRGGNWGSAYSSSMIKHERSVTVFTVKKNSPINLSCIKAAQTLTLGVFQRYTSYDEPCYLGKWLQKYLLPCWTRFYAQYHVHHRKSVAQ